MRVNARVGVWVCACVCVGRWVGGWVRVSTQTSPAPVRNKLPIKTNHAYRVDGPFLFLTAYPVRSTIVQYCTVRTITMVQMRMCLSVCGDVCATTHTHAHTKTHARARVRALPQHKRPLRAKSRKVPSEICHPARNMPHYLILSDTALAGSRESGGIGCTIIIMCAFVLFSVPRATSLKARCREA